MSGSDPVDIKTASIDELVADLQVRAAKQPADWENWLIAQGIYPGTTKVYMCDLHAAYRQYWMDTPGMTGKLLGHRQLGKHLTTRFKAGRGQKGVFYYISRTAQPNIG